MFKIFIFFILKIKTDYDLEGEMTKDTFNLYFLFCS